MIRNSFIFLEKVGRKKEIQIFRQGITNWDKFLATEKVSGFSARAKKYYDSKINEAQKELYNFNSGYFAKILPQSEHWRLFEFFKDEVVYLDIEIDNYNDISVIGLFDGINTKTMVRGVNLEMQLLKKELQNFKILVTFNGSVFDLPYIKKRYGAILPNIPHLDLRFACKQIGLKGGLKEIERTLGIKRRSENTLGGDALLLRKKWLATGDEDFLMMLIEYNEEDVINLKKIAEHCALELTNKAKSIT